MFLTFQANQASDRRTKQLNKKLAFYKLFLLFGNRTLAHTLCAIVLLPQVDQRSNQIFHYTRCITPKGATSLRGLSPRHCACEQHSSAMSQQWRVVGNTAFDLASPRFEPQTSGSRGERVTARPTAR